MSEITKKIKKTVQKHNMLQKGDFVVVGVSGGADSMLLLKFLKDIQKKLDLRILAANVEHGIRGEESLSDSLFVENYCKQNGIEFQCLRIDAPSLAKEAGKGIEEYSREKRYEFFESFSPDKIATAHNLSDNVETVLFRLSRGTSLSGCCGIPKVRGKIIRPLIELTSVEIRQECKSASIPYVIDSTNSDNSYSRNYIRNVVIPDFSKLNPSFEKTFQRFISSAAEDSDFLESQAEICFDACFSENALDIKKLKEYHISVVKRAIILLAEKNSISLDELHLNGIFDLLSKRGKFQIKNNIYAISDLKTLRISEIDNSYVKFSFIEEVIDVKDFLNKCELLKKEFNFYCDCDKISGSISVRQRIEGDFIVPEKRNCTKSLKKLFNELKIPSDKRNKIPIIADDIGVIGVSSYCTDERVRIDEKTKRVLLIRITED
ncbi:MAG: tRNA lysidine(34) synthetase TilS [Eubacterium sp.]|nr:tRNA lysidine(34) synthetase TilS [Eubacterium sp.]